MIEGNFLTPRQLETLREWRETIHYEAIEIGYGSTFGRIFCGDEIVGHYFSCKIDEDTMLRSLCESYYEESQDEPNSIDTRHVRLELGDRKMVNLGRRVNRIPSNTVKI